MKKKYTIKDIAKLAGVSKGTVDRVLHKRGKVSEKAHKKVETVLREIEYQPNPIARNLRENRIYKICVIIPDMAKDPYWIPAHEGICEAAREFRPFGIMVDEFFYDPKDRSAFVEKSREAIASCPDVLLMAPLFQVESSLILQQCRKKQVRVAFFNNYINALDNAIFIGQDLHRTGRIAAGLIHKMVGPGAKIAIIHLDKEPHMQLKENGFLSYFEMQKEKFEFASHCISSTDDTAEFEATTMKFLQQNPDVSAIFVTNSKAFKMVELLKKNNLHCVVVGYDLLEKNIEYLKEGTIDFLIHQQPKNQAYLSIQYFSEFFLFGKEIPDRKFLPIDIVTSENIDYYLE